MVGHRCLGGNIVVQEEDTTSREKEARRSMVIVPTKATGYKRTKLAEDLGDLEG